MTPDPKITPVRGKVLEIDLPASAERDWIFQALQDPAVHVPLGLKQGPARELFDAARLDLWRGDAMRREPVRYHILRRLADRQPVGFFLDFGWDHPSDKTREIDLAFPDPKTRGIASYLDATVIVAQFLFKNGLAKRLRWRVDARGGQEPRRSTRQGARLLWRQEERHPVSGAWTVKYVYEYAIADMEALGRFGHIDPRVDYADTLPRVFDSYRTLKGDKG
ncbi:MAG: hypothetical protein HY903_00470 [Deltaproteobacteria bacterium]|nr:hypothetical protein [Deltaproteobacteria bacterium]